MIADSASALKKSVLCARKEFRRRFFAGEHVIRGRIKPGSDAQDPNPRNWEKINAQAETFCRASVTQQELPEFYAEPPARQRNPNKHSVRYSRCALVRQEIVQRTYCEGHKRYEHQIIYRNFDKHYSTYEGR